MSPQRWRVASDLFHAALEQPSSRVDEFLRAECGSDTELYAQLCEMLREHLRSGALDRPVVEFFDDNRPVFREGQLVAGRYRIMRFIGRGGMGEVYEAEDHDLNERIAVKTLLPTIAGDARMVSRFKQEIQLSRKIGHPNVCRVFDLARETVEASEKAVVFLTMEFLDGETLETRICRDGPLSSTEALPILEQMSQGLNAAHRAGILHRDLKPSNVMLVPRAVITDFGLASSFSVSGDTAPTITAPLMGTLDYMAPELLKNQHPSVSSDIYALGMVAYKTVTGSLPFASDPPLAAAILRSRMPVPGPRALVPDLDPAWDRAILRALDADPSRRFSNAGAFAAALRGESSALTLPLPVLTRRRVIGGGIAAAALAAAGISWPMLARLRNRPPAEALRFYHIGVDDIHAGAYFAATKALSEAVRLTPHFSLAHARLAEAWNALDLTETASQEMLLARRQDLSGLSRPDRLQVEAIDLTITREFDSAVTKYEQMRRYFDPADAGFQLDLGRAYENAALPQRAIESYRRAAEGPAQDPAAWLRLAILYSRAADAAKTAQAFRQAEDRYQLTSNLEGLTEVAIQQGISANARGRLEEAATYLQKALETARAAGNLHQEIVAKLQLGTNAYLGGDPAASERYAQEALTTAQANDMQALAIRGIVGLGASHFRRTDYAGAEKYYRDGLDLARSHASRRLEALALLQLASVDYQLRHLADSATEAQGALVFYQANRFSRETLQCLTLLGRVQSAMGDFAGATDWYRKALVLAETAQDRYQMALAHENLGGIFADQEQYPDALREFQQYLTLSADDEHSGYAARDCADTLWRLGRYSEASPMYDKADAKAKQFPSLRVWIVISRAEMVLSQQRYSDAVALCRTALASSPDAVETAQATRILALARIGEGAGREALRQSEIAAALADKTGDVSIQVPAHLALAEAFLSVRDNRGALSILEALLPKLEALPESHWRALSLAVGADQNNSPQYAAAAKQQLDAIARQWGDAVFAAYIKRPDLQKLQRPLFAAFTANHN